MTWSTAALTVKEAERAIYVDYEGTPFTPPTVLGVFVETEMAQWIVEEEFRDCAGRLRANAHFRLHAELLRELLKRAAKEERRIVSWSTHDPKLMTPVLTDDEAGNLAGLYRNAIKTARRWRRLYRPEAEARHTLNYYMELLAWKVPGEAGQGVVGTSIRVVRRRLGENGGLWRELSTDERDRWRNVLRHNRHDLRGMKKVVVRMCRDLARSS